MELVVIIIGGNLGNRSDLILHAKKILQENIGKPILLSSIFESKAWGKASKNDFLNQILVFETNITAERLLEIAQEAENELGRIRNEKWGDRTMDIDILYVGQKVINKSDLVIPHSFISQRRFVLEPLAEILPDFIHPIFKISNRQLLENCKDMNQVSKLSQKRPAF